VRIGVFGGSFDPIHLGHLIVAEAAADALALDRVLFVPARRQPLKGEGHEAAAADRAEMVRLAIAGHPRLLLDRRELERPGPSYTVDTLRALRAEGPGETLFLLVGADAARELPQWHEVAALSGLAHVVVLTRPGVPPPATGLAERVLAVPAVDISATAIRERVRRGEPIAHLVPPAVARYIEAKGLYSERR
jgi:nicotinate-nucleotide adenylyltransferase